MSSHAASAACLEELQEDVLALFHELLQKSESEDESAITSASDR